MRLGQFIAAVFAVLIVMIEVQSGHVISNLASWFPKGGIVANWLSRPDVDQFVRSYGVWGLGILALTAFFWSPLWYYYFGPAIPAHQQPYASMSSVFMSGFGRYRTGWVNVYVADDSGTPLARSVRSLSEQKKIYAVNSVIPGLIYRVKLLSPYKDAHVFIKRYPNRQYTVVAFGDVPFV